MSTINFSGLASGLDTRAIVDAILSVERQPLERLQERQGLFSQKKASYDELKAKLGAFEASLRDLSAGRAFRGRTTSVSDESALRVSAGTGAETGVFEVEVFSLARAHKVKSDGFAATDDSAPVADGTLTIQSGSNDLITIDVSAANGNNTLAAVRDAINAADAGVGASIIFDGTSYLLTVRAEESGTANALTISDGTNLNLDGAGNVITAAADASIAVDGIAVQSATNKITGVIEGVTLDLLGISSGAVGVEIGRDSDTAVAAVDKLIADYNGLIGFFNEQFNRDDPGPLNGDAATRTIQSRIQSLFVSGVDGVAVGGIRSLSAIGVSFDGQTGEASLDQSRLQELLDTRFEEVGDLFAPSGRASDAQVQFLSASGSTRSGEYAVEITRAAEQAFVVGATVMDKLSQDETLTIRVDGQQVDILLMKNDLIANVVSRLNLGLEAAGIAATASDDGGKLRISGQAYGSEESITVVSSRSATNARSAGIGSVPLVDSGEDVAGTIGGFAATGSRRVLTADEGSAAAGIQIQVNASADDVATKSGLFGNVNFTGGFVNIALSRVSGFTRFGEGSIDASKKALDQLGRALDSDVARIEERLLARETQLLLAFSRAERAISSLQGQQSTLGAISRF